MTRIRADIPLARQQQVLSEGGSSSEDMTCLSFSFPFLMTFALCAVQQCLMWGALEGDKVVQACATLLAVFQSFHMCGKARAFPQ